MSFDKISKLYTALVVLGITTLLSQLVIIRELLNIFQGNELIIGLILCIWMLLTAIGSNMGTSTRFKHASPKTFSYLFLLEGVLPVAQIILLHILVVKIFPPGMTKGFNAALIVCTATLWPFCITSGFLFTMIATSISRDMGKNRISKAYGMESAGSVLAGIMFSLFLAYLLSTFQILALLLFINILVYVILYPWEKFGTGPVIVPMLLFIGGLYLMTGEPDNLIRKPGFKNQDLVYSRDTPFGNVSVTSNSGQMNVFENGTLFFSTQNDILQEEAVHFALLQRAHPERVLIVSGGYTGMSKQALKYKTVKSIDYIEINPWLVKAEGLISKTVTDKRVNLIKKDPRSWISRSERVYDAIIIATPDPYNARLNRYYSAEFFLQVKNALKLNGVLEISLGPVNNYMNAETVEVNGIIYQTLKSIFLFVQVAPGERNYFISSDAPVGIDFARRAELTELSNDYVNQYYIQDDLLKQNSINIIREINLIKHPINTDLMPVAYFSQIKNWLTLMEGKWFPASVVVMLLFFTLPVLFISIRKLSPVTMGIFTGGLAGASIEFLILILFQINFGYIYQMIGLIMAFYMTGLTLGAFKKTGALQSSLVKNYIIIQMIMLGIVLLFPVLSIRAVKFSSYPGWIIQLILCIYTFSMAFMAGLEFNLASKLEKSAIEKVAGNLYGIDLAGAAFGTFFCSLLFFPLFGLTGTCLFLAIFLLASILIMLIFRKRYLHN